MELAAQGAHKRDRRVTLAALLSSNIINIGFLLYDPRMWRPELFTGSALLAGAVGYVVALPLCWADERAGYALALVLTVLASLVVVGDNFAIFGSRPNEITYTLNFAFFAVQIPLAISSARRLGLK